MGSMSCVSFFCVSMYVACAHLPSVHSVALFLCVVLGSIMGLDIWVPLDSAFPSSTIELAPQACPLARTSARRGYCFLPSKLPVVAGGQHESYEYFSDFCDNKEVNSYCEKKEKKE